MNTYRSYRSAGVDQLLGGVLGFVADVADATIGAGTAVVEATLAPTPTVFEETTEIVVPKPTVTTALGPLSVAPRMTESTYIPPDPSAQAVPPSGKNTTGAEYSVPGYDASSGAVYDAAAVPSVGDPSIYDVPIITTMGPGTVEVSPDAFTGGGIPWWVWVGGGAALLLLLGGGAKLFKSRRARKAAAK